MKDEQLEYKVLVNHEEQYSLWPTFKTIPPGWRQVGQIGSKAFCVTYVESVWTDIRPLSVRRTLEEAEIVRDRTRNCGGPRFGTFKAGTRPMALPRQLPP